MINDYKNASDDFIELFLRWTQHEVIALASPVYWYAPSAQMKCFLDRWSDITRIHKNIKSRLEYKTSIPHQHQRFRITPIRDL